MFVGVGVRCALCADGGLTLLVSGVAWRFALFVLRCEALFWCSVAVAVCCLSGVVRCGDVLRVGFLIAAMCCVIVVGVCCCVWCVLFVVGVVRCCMVVFTDWCCVL